LIKREPAQLSFPAPAPGQCSPDPPPEQPPTDHSSTGAFFAAARTSLRGFALNQAGPRDACTGFPVGGQATLVLNQEFRFPMRLPFIGTSLGGAIFYDGGNVYSRLSRISFRAMLAGAHILAAKSGTTCGTNERARVRHELHERTQLLRSHHRFGREI